MLFQGWGQVFPNYAGWDEFGIDTTSFEEGVKRTWSGMDENISVIIPIRNEEEKITQCLEAVFSQSLKAHEVIVVDDTDTPMIPWRWRDGAAVQ